MKTPVQTRPPPQSRGGKFHRPRPNLLHPLKSRHSHRAQGRYLIRSVQRCSSVMSPAPGGQPARVLELGGPAVEGIRWKPDAILLQTDGHRKLPLPRRSRHYGRFMVGASPGNTTVDDGWINVRSESCRRALKLI